MRYLHHGAWFLRLREERAEGRAAARAVRLGDDRPRPFRVVCAWHERAQGANVTHSICPECAKRMLKDLE